MSDPKIPELYKRTTPSWQKYQRDNLWQLNEGKKAPFNTDPAKLEDEARESLSIGGRYCAHSNAGLSHNTLSYHTSWSTRITETQRLLSSGINVLPPIGFAPVGINTIYHQLGELPVAKVAGELRLPYGLSTAGSTSIEEVAAANDAGAALPDAVKIEGAETDTNLIRFFQLYMPHDDELTISLLTRAAESGYTACILTTDTWQLGWRHDDVATSDYAFYRGMGADLGLTDPVFQRRLKEEGIDPARDPQRAGALWIDNKEISGDKAFLLKGIQSVKDSRKAAEVGCDDIVVSNHAGRQVDGAKASLDALEDIINAGIGEKIVVTFDSGVRGGSDIIKAISLGAKFVWIGRLWVWGLSIMGEEGVRHVMRSLLADFDIAMAVGGFKSIEDMTKDRLESGPRIYNLMLEKAHL